MFAGSVGCDSGQATLTTHKENEKARHDPAVWFDKVAYRGRCVVEQCAWRTAEMQIAAEAGLPLYREGPRKDQPRRRTIRVKEQTHVGYATIVQGLTADESIRLQEEGLGGRQLMGCGLFLPEKGRD